MDDTLMLHASEDAASSLMTPLGLVEGEVLMLLERQGATPMRRLVRELAWPAPWVMMAVGALIRDGMARAVQHDLEVMVHPLPGRHPVPVEGLEVWGG